MDVGGAVWTMKDSDLAAQEKEHNMLDFIGTNWIWILLIGGMLVMHLGHGHGGHGGHGGHRGKDAEDPATQPSDEHRH